MTTDILRALQCGPMTNAELQQATGRTGRDVGSRCNYLLNNGQVERVDGRKAGRGYPAIYALTGRGPPERRPTQLRAEIESLRSDNAAMRELLDIAVEDHDSSMGRSNVPEHWTNRARAALTAIGGQDGR